MVKDKTSALERAKKAAVQGKGKKSARGGSSSRTALPKDWIQGDWMPSVIRQDDLDDLVEGGLIRHESARLPGKEVEPQPLDGECVLLATHIDRGFSLPPHPFFPELFELLQSAAPSFHSQFHRVSCGFRFLVRKFLGLPPSLGTL